MTTKPKTRRLKPKKDDPVGTIRYGAPKGNAAPAFGDQGLIDAVDRHITKHVGKPKTVFHEIISLGIHVDVHMVAPTKSRPNWLLITSGMSERPMLTPRGVRGCTHTELAIALPKWWKLDDASLKQERWYWPIRWLKTLARFPHEFETWLFYEHTVPLADELPAPGTKFCGVVMATDDSFPEKFWRMRFRNRTIYFLSPIPLYQEEMDLKLEQGSDALGAALGKINKGGPWDSYDPKRPNAIKPASDAKRPSRGPITAKKAARRS